MQYHINNDNVIISSTYQNAPGPSGYTVDPMLSASGNLFKCHEEVLYLQPLIPPKRFDIFSPITGGCSLKNVKVGSEATITELLHGIGSTVYITVTLIVM